MVMMIMIILVMMSRCVTGFAAPAPRERGHCHAGYRRSVAPLTLVPLAAFCMNESYHRHVNLRDDSRGPWGGRVVRPAVSSPDDDFGPAEEGATRM
jgi:hypothetical protein